MEHLPAGANPPADVRWPGVPAGLGHRPRTMPVATRPKPVRCSSRRAAFDGASHWQIFTRVILPLSGPALSALAIFTFLFNWNSFLYPLVVTNSVRMSTLTVGLNTLQGQYNTAWTLLMAGSVLALLPVLTVFLLAQRYFIKSITLTGIGGR